MSHDTVLQQGDQVGTQGDAGVTGATGGTGTQGAFTNVLSVELVYTFIPEATPSAISLATTYIVEAGASGFWKASGVHSYVNSAFATNPGITTISNFLDTDTTKKFSVHLQLQKTKILDSDGNIILLPSNITARIVAEIYDTSDDNIVIRFLQGSGGAVASFQTASDSFRVRELKFSLLIIGTDG